MRHLRKFFPLLLVLCAVFALAGTASAADEGEWEAYISRAYIDHNMVNVSIYFDAPDSTDTSNISVFSAVYDADGRMLDLRTVPVGDSVSSGMIDYSFDFGDLVFETAKVFLLNDQFEPVCQAQTAVDTALKPTLSNLTFDVNYGDGNIDTNQPISISNTLYPANDQIDQKFGSFVSGDSSRVEYWVHLPGNTPPGTIITIKPEAQKNCEVYKSSVLSFTTVANVNEYYTYAYVVRNDRSSDTSTYIVHFTKSNNTDVDSLTISGGNIKDVELSMTDIVSSSFFKTENPHLTFRDVTIESNAGSVNLEVGEVLTLSVGTKGTATLNGARTITLESDTVNGGLKGSATFTVTSHLWIGQRDGTDSHYSYSTDYTVNVHT